MNLPNKLTIFRIILVPIMVIIASIPYLNSHVAFLGISISHVINLPIFVIASLTDMLDGHIARKYNMVTTFGKFLDPIADKLLVLTTMIILFAEFNGTSIWWYIPLFALVIMVGREIIISGIRLVCVEKGVVIAASKLGKLKTIFQMASLILLFLYQVEIGSVHIFGIVGAICFYIALVLSIVSLIEYFVKNRKNFSTN